MNRSKSWIVVCQYGGMWFIKKRFDSQKPAMDFMNGFLNKEEKKASRRGAKAICHIYELFGSYSN